jgi:hypothetical protein
MSHLNGVYCANNVLRELGPYRLIIALKFLQYNRPFLLGIMGANSSSSFSI